MCGIIGYVGANDTAGVLLNSLELLEYRGYDSAGVAFHNGKDISIFKCPGRVSQLRELVGDHNGSCGIGHTRWATHGVVSYENAHPHQAGQVTMVHNGIIENYRELISEYSLEDRLVSTGDTEVAAILLDRFYSGDPFAAISRLTSTIRGTYAFAIMFTDRPDEIYAVRHISPIVVTRTDDECVLASDLMPLAAFSSRYCILPEHAILRMTAEDFSIRNYDGEVLEAVCETIDWEVEQLNRRGYATYMEKEISEQPDVIYRTFSSRIKDGLPDLTGDGVTDDILRKATEVNIVACGTSYHAGLVGKYLIEKYAGVRTNVYLASEFIYSDVIMDPSGILIAISQSGETIDTLEAAKIARRRGITSMAIVNVKGSSLANTVDYRLFTNAGPEIAVASTKAYTCQLSILYLLAFRLALIKEKTDREKVRVLTAELIRVPAACSEILKNRHEYDQLAARIKDSTTLFMIGRGLDYYVLMEGSLKLKEISYIHSETYASGELKHGPIALIDKEVPVIAAVTQQHLLTKEASNINEVVARDATVHVLIKQACADQLVQKVDLHLLPDLEDDFMVFPCVVALQWIAYYSAVHRGLNVDKPRNLAKVVTVE